MMTTPQHTFTADVRVDAVPAWVNELLRGSSARIVDDAMNAARVQVREGDAFSLVSMRVSEARELAPAQFEQITLTAYSTIQRLLYLTPSPHPVRFWNILPEIHRPADDGTDRYMTFNAGRFKALCDWFGGSDAFARLVPAASGVGHDDDELIIHALGSASPAMAISNPRQIAPYCYSRRFGPLPPCFARATLTSTGSDSSMLLVGGTASIRGEDSVHVQSLEQQTNETLENLACLVAAAANKEYEAGDRAKWLRHYRDLRVYYVRPGDRSMIAKMLADSFGEQTRIDFVRANLCRAELLVEIEGVAECRVLSPLLCTQGRGLG